MNPAALTSSVDGREFEAVSSRPNRLACELGLIVSLWRRDMLHLVRERSRWLGVVVQPLLFWIVIGSGMSSVFSFPAAQGVDYLEYFFPGVLAMVVLFTTVFATMSVIDDRQHGFLQQVMVAPVSRTALVLGKTAGVTTVTLIQVALCMVVAPAAGFGWATVDWLGLVAVLVSGCAGLCAMNFALAWIVSSTGGYHGIMSVFLLPLWILSGAMFPPQAGWIEGVMWANPMAYLVDGVRHALYGGSAVATRLGLWPSVFVLVGFAVVALLLAERVVKRRAHGGRP